MLDLQERLGALGHSCDPDPPGRFGPATQSAVKTFQRSRGLAQDGVVGPDSWRALVEAGYRLGDRLLYHRRPMMRGEDVADLQRQLSALGFDAGKVDGIFGPVTARAVLDFQQNKGMAEDGIVGPEVTDELQAVARATHKAGRAEIRELVWLRSLPASVVGSRIFLDPACVDAEESEVTWQVALAAFRLLQARGAVPILSRSSDTRLLPGIRARRANRAAADLVVSFETPHDHAEGTFYFESLHSRSEAGMALATAIASLLGTTAEGRAPVMLRETRAPAVVVCLKDLGEKTARCVVDGIVGFFGTDHRKS